jgi:acyl carrier protein
MLDVRQRLAKCFSAVFPELSPEDFGETNDYPAVNCDSLSAVTLLAVVEEEFGIDLGLNDMENASFPEILERVSEAIRNRAPVDSSPVH